MKNSIALVFLIACFIPSCQKEGKSIETSDQIRLNQVGYYPTSVKEFILVDTDATGFQVVDQDDNVIMQGELVQRGEWPTSGEQVALGDFSDLQAPGTYSIIVDEKLMSYPFQVNTDIYKDAFQAAIKSFYFQRASMGIDENYGGAYARAAGHEDDNCQFHPSSGHTEGTLSSPGGWYDAGDYGKYVVNGALSVGQMLNLVEQYPDVVVDGDLNIPESANGKSDLLDELKYELDWIMTMQDSDGGVFHKLTAKNFSSFIMPEAYDLERLIIGKGTVATLNFAAVLAQASRIYVDTDPSWSKMALKSAKNAWEWAMVNNDIAYRNPKDVVTGEYGDDVFTDDFYWAAAELYITTSEDVYLNYLVNNEEPYIHELTNSWKFFIRNTAFHSLLENRLDIDAELSKILITAHIELAAEILAQIEANPYHIALDRYEWGSNSDILNQAVILCYAHRLTGDEKYLDGAEQITDYIFGKNATGFCFLTGYGTKQVMLPHHRPSGADGIEYPVPGFIAGGPNGHKQDARSGVEYAFDTPAKSYEDVEPSYASNEVCLNWNAPAVYVLGYLGQVR